MLMKDIIQYIKGFLTGADKKLTTLIGYTSDETRYDQYALVIRDSGFFADGMYGSKATLPALPLQQWEEIPILFGEGITEKHGNTIVIHADIIAGTYYLISRYEEMVRSDVRDQYGRFPGKESLPYRAGFIDRPIIEEWGAQLRLKMREAGLDIPEPAPGINKVYLTHDVDQMAHYRTIRGMLGGVLRGIKRRKEGQMALKSYFGGVIFDPWYTFPFMYKLDDELRQKIGPERCEIITFFRAGGNTMKEDKPFPVLTHPDYKTLIRYTRRKKIGFGLHTSFEAGCNPEKIPNEVSNLSKHTRQEITYNRNHYLNSREPADFEHLIANGITDDFTMGYADMAGFRLGTCKPVKWINPASRKLTNLTLHSLIIMDCTLHEKKYMYMNSFDAYQYCVRLADCVEKYNGDLVLLWHNTMMEKSAKLYHRKLYHDLLLYLHEK
jgi:hypothetical protein